MAKLKNSLVILYDCAFYLMFIPIFMLCLGLLYHEIPKVNLISSSLASSMQTTGLAEVDSALTSLLFEILGIIFLFLLLILLNISIFKNLLWKKELKEKIEIKHICKSLLLTFLLVLIFFVPIMISLMPVLISAAEYVSSAMSSMYAEPKTPSFWQFTPFLIVLFFAIYFTTISNCIFAKTGNIRSIIESFKVGIKFFSKLVPYFILTFICLSATFALEYYLKLSADIVGYFLFVAVAVSVSYFERKKIVPIIMKC